MLRPIISKVGSRPLEGFFRSSFTKYKPFAPTLAFAPLVKRAISYQAPTASRFASPANGQPVNWVKIATQLGTIGGTVIALNFFLNRETIEGGIPAAEQAYLHETFKYVAGGLGITALAARGLHVNGWSARFMALNPWVALVGGLAFAIGIHCPREL